jgi:hypothetical protein
MSRTTKPVFQYDLEGNFIQEFPSMSEASRILNIHLSTIFIALRDGTTANNFLFTRTLFNKLPPYTGKIKKPYVKRERKNKMFHVYQYDLEGNFIREFSSVNEMSSVLSIKNGNIYSAARNYTETNGFQFRRSDDTTVILGASIGKYRSRNGKAKSIALYDLEGNFVKKYNSITECSKAVGRCASMISICLSSQRRVNDFQLRYVDNNSTYENSIEKYTKRMVTMHSYHTAQYDKEGNFLMKFESLKEASSVLGIETFTIAMSTQRFSLVNKLFQFRRVSDSNIDTYKDSIGSHITSHIQNRLDREKTIYEFDLQGSLLRKLDKQEIIDLDPGIYIDIIKSCNNPLSKSYKGKIYSFQDYIDGKYKRNGRPEELKAWFYFGDGKNGLCLSKGALELIGYDDLNFEMIIELNEEHIIDVFLLRSETPTITRRQNNTKPGMLKGANELHKYFGNHQHFQVEKLDEQLIHLIPLGITSW